MSDFTIIKLETKQKDLVESSPRKEIIPAFPFRAMFSGASRSGKTNLLLSLITDKRFYFKNGKSYFDLIFLFSGSAFTDDVWMIAKNLIKTNHRFSTLDTRALGDIWDIQEEIVKTKGVGHSPKILIIFDDCIDSKNITKPEFQKIFFRGRHLNIGLFIATQKYNRVPFALREQITNHFIFKPKQKEMKLIIDELTPAGLTEKQMAVIMQTATSEPYSFIHIDTTQPLNKMFRKNLDVILRYS